MKEITQLAEIQKIELEMLKYVDGFCRKNNLTYYLAYGTLLGAIRHKGFIPWDDDTDIAMPRPDYDKFIKLMSNQTNNKDHYAISCVETSKHDYNYPWAKVWDTRTKVIEIDNYQKEDFGLYIDIFPIEGLGDTYDEALNTRKKIEVNKYRIWCIHAMKKKGLKGRALNLIGRKNINRIMKIECNKRNFYSAKYVGSVMSSNLHPEIIKGEDYREKCEAEFEDGKFYIPKGYDEILKLSYEDYMTPPRKVKDIPIMKRTFIGGKLCKIIFHKISKSNFIVLSFYEPHHSIS